MSDKPWDDRSELELRIEKLEYSVRRLITQRDEWIAEAMEWQSCAKRAQEELRKLRGEVNE